MSDESKEILPPQHEVANATRFGEFKDWIRNKFPSLVKPQEIEKPASPQPIVEIANLDNLTVKEDILNTASITNNPEDVIDHQPEPIQEEIVTKRTTNIATIFEQAIRSLPESIPPEVDGVLAAINTNETSSADFFEEIRAKKPDGFIIGVGAGNVFSMMECFETDTIPRGMVLADINTKVVTFGKLLVESLQHTSSRESFFQDFFKLTSEQLLNRITALTEKLEDPVLKERIQQVDKESWFEELKDIRSFLPNNIDNNSYPLKLQHTEGDRMLPVNALLNNYQKFKQLADENNISVVLANFTSKPFIETVRALPEFTKSSNIVYYSNIVDHITQRGAELENAKIIQNLKAYESSEKKPVFIDTLGMGLNYFLRARHTVAEYSNLDFLLGPKDKKEKPPGLLFADEKSTEQYNWKKLSNQEILEAVKKIEENPLCQERIQMYEEKNKIKYLDNYIHQLALQLYNEEMTPQKDALNPDLVYGAETVQLAHAYREMINRVYSANSDQNLWNQPFSSVISEFKNLVK